MGVKGLWKLLDGTGQPITLESLEGKVLAIDISLWLNMAVKGMRDVHGHSANDAHLITLFNRICKLLYFGVKPVFVFDGKAPLIKQRTLQQRQENRSHHANKSRLASQKLLQNYLKRQVLNMAIKSTDKKGDSTTTSGEIRNNPNQLDSLNEIIRTKKNEEEDMFVLPEPKFEQQLNSSDDEKEEQWLKRSSTREAVYGSAMMGDFKQMMSIDVNSQEFQSLPPDIQHELLSDIKEIRKRRRTQFEKMPESSNSFSNYQLKGLLAKRSITDRIEQVEKRMQQDNATTMTALGYDENLYEAESVNANQLISDENTRYILISKLAKKQITESEKVSVTSIDQKPQKVDKDSLVKLEKEDTFVNDSKGDFEKERIIDELVVEKQTSVDASLAESEKSDKSEEPNSLVPSPKQDFSSDENVLSVSNNTRIDRDLITDQRGEGEPLSVSGHHVNASAPEDSLSKNESSPKSGFLRVSTEDLKRVEQRVASGQDVDNSSSNNANTDVINLDLSTTVSAVDGDLTVDTAANSSLDKNPRIGSLESDEDFLEVEEAAVDEVPRPTVVDASEGDKDVDTDESDVSEEANPWLEFADEDMVTIQEQMDAEDVALVERMKSSARAARDLSDVATSESQQLLQMFGIPYLVSPQEAESQCAYLDACGLTTGTITDDSDVLLFGGRVVYKSIFDKKHDPSMYSINSIKAELGLDRSHLINIALCSGSDYTVGIENVGPVAALEIMKEFPGPGIESLLNFATWWKKAHEQVSIPPSETKIKRRLRKVNLPPEFPSQLVVDAYLNPVIDPSKESFSWGIPDLDAIRNFLIERLNWTKGKVDETLLPVLKRTSERHNKQRLLTDYFNNTAPLQATRKKKSKRVSRAIFGIAESRNAHPEANVKQGKRKGRQKSSTSTVVSKRETTDASVCLSESSSSDSS